MERSALKNVLRSIKSLLSSSSSALSQQNCSIDASIGRKIRALICECSTQTLEIELPTVAAAATAASSQQQRGAPFCNIYSADVYADESFCASIFGVHRAGGRIPLHDHVGSWGAIRVLRGRIRVRSYSWMEADKERAIFTDETIKRLALPLDTWPVKYEGWRDF